MFAPLSLPLLRSKLLLILLPTFGREDLLPFLAAWFEAPVIRRLITEHVKPYIAEFQQRHEADVAGETSRLVLMLSPVLALTLTSTLTPSVLIVHEITAAQLRCALQSSTSSLTVEVSLPFPNSL